MNFSNLTLIPVQETIINVKDVCYGLVGVNLLILVLFLIAINFLCFFFWNNVNIKIKIFGKEFNLLYFLPVINACVLIYVFVYIYNLF